MTHTWQMHCGGERLVVMGVACVANHAHSDKALWVGFMLAWAVVLDDRCYQCWQVKVAPLLELLIYQDLQ